MKCKICRIQDKYDGDHEPEHTLYSYKGVLYCKKCLKTIKGKI